MLIAKVETGKEYNILSAFFLKEISVFLLFNPA